jgi:3-methylcrotonyl-CoA carboxylase alpha subunit
VGAGTVEFIVEQRAPTAMPALLHGDEHPAAGGAPGHRGHHRPGPGGVAAARGRRRAAAAAQDELRITGHAIEARICAENPDNNFLPATGTLQVCAGPAHVAFASSAHARCAWIRRARGRRHQPVLRLDGGQAHRARRHREQALARLDAALAAHPHRGPGDQRAVPAPGGGAAPTRSPGRPGHRADRAREAVLFKQEPWALPLAAAAAVAAHAAGRARQPRAPTPSAAATAGARTGCRCMCSCRRGATQIVAIDLLAHAGEDAVRGRPPDRAHAGQGGVVRRAGGRQGAARASPWP